MFFGVQEVLLYLWVVTVVQVVIIGVRSVEHLGSYFIIKNSDLLFLLYLVNVFSYFPKDFSLTEYVAFTCVGGLSCSKNVFRVFPSREMSCASFSKHIVRLQWVIESTVRGESRISASSRMDLLLCGLFVLNWNLLFTVDSCKKVHCSCTLNVSMWLDASFNQEFVETR